MFSKVRKFLTLWSGAFMSNRLPQVLKLSEEGSPRDFPKAGKGKGRRGHKPSNGAAMKRAAQKRKGVALNKARHAR